MKLFKRLFLKNYIVSFTFHLSESDIALKAIYLITKAESEAVAIIAAKEEFYSQIENNYSKPIPDGKLEIFYCEVRKGLI